MSNSQTRPQLRNVVSVEEFRRWYWLKTELVQYCKSKGISTTGRKLELADRIAEYLETGQVTKVTSRKAGKSSFNWAKAALTVDTIILDNVTFGKNFRGFMTEQIGKKFVCHSDFMDWVKANVGKTLGDAVTAWYDLEKRKQNPNFKRMIAPQNMLAQYTRDFFEDNPDKTRADLMRCWELKKALPNENGVVVYEPSDLTLS